eukprot:TRINITY_DN68205_c5_g1_i1.p2 TRINITY_DN68205_c5_g1~~TRINITY_DN68205_c5_g1_i1.p2  ORF type:complete len:418 (-),score=233.54 TRINITY_DN68205_c5_g1_i1:1167-2420(-)
MSQKTRLVQKAISSPSQALKVFAQSSKNEVPLVLIPSSRWFWSCWLEVPSGVYSIPTYCGKDTDPNRLAPEGLQCLPSCYDISHCITPQACNYEAPVKRCPTRDDVMVDADITLVLQIGPEPQDVRKFVYTLGARRFEQYLATAVEEGIRHLIRNCWHYEIYELRGAGDPRVVKTLQELNKKFEAFGVSFKQAAITDVHFSEELQQCLQDTTNFKSKINEQQKQQRHAMDQIQFNADREMKELIKEHERAIQELQATRTRLLLDRKKRMTEVESYAEVKQTDALKQARVDQTKAESELAVAERAAQKHAQQIEARVRALGDKIRIQAQQEHDTRLVQSAAKAQAATFEANAVRQEAMAEREAAQKLKTKREHDLAMAKQEVYQNMARNTKVVIGGPAGSKILDSIVNDKVLGEIKLQ